MRTSALLLGLVAVTGCYNVGDLGDRPFKCIYFDNGGDLPECPDGYYCDGTFCVPDEPGGGSQALTLNISKSGTYDGTITDNPELDDGCLDGADNDTLRDSVPLGTGEQKLSVCPPRDVDVFRFDLGSSPQYLRVNLSYQVRHGDIDVAILDQSGTIKFSDGTATDDACVTSSSMLSGVVYVGVVGAANAKNVYTIRALSQSGSPLICSGGS